MVSCYNENLEDYMRLITAPYLFICLFVFLSLSLSLSLPGYVCLCISLSAHLSLCICLSFLCFLSVYRGVFKTLLHRGALSPVMDKEEGHRSLANCGLTTLCPDKDDYRHPPTF